MVKMCERITKDHDVIPISIVLRNGITTLYLSYLV